MLSHKSFVFTQVYSEKISTDINYYTFISPTEQSLLQ